MEEQKTSGAEPQEKKLSRTTLTFYITGLCLVAIALILISYVAQSRSAKQLENLNTQLSEQQTAAQGAAQKMEVLQKQLDEQQKLIDQLGALYDADAAGLADAAQQSADEHDAYALLARINAQLLAENEQDAQDAYDELVKTFGEERLRGVGEHAFGAEINKLFEAVQARFAADEPQQADE